MCVFVCVFMNVIKHISVNVLSYEVLSYNIYI